ncbi:MAG: acyl-CoA dehydrogenase family protein [Candidatus Bathyarchaeota archaeon]|nr:acyl-CoA dehydrogenase family protein [Candidatus Bathyarchaeota archaeon]
MDFRDTPEEAAFRQEVREFLKTELRDEWKAAPDEGEGDVAALYERRRPWREKLAVKGWIAPAWPKEYGGAGLTVMQQFIMNEEFAEARAPARDIFGVGMVGPTLIVHGSEEQKKEHLPRILSGEVRWCQGYSEPEAGSDLASLRMRAVKDGDDYIINGQKIWTSAAQYAQWIFMLARTDPEAPKHRGISYFLADMKTPGIEVRPLVDLSGRHLFNEVFFENVRVPARNLVGEENRGWYIGTTTLDFERSNVGAAVENRLLVEGLAKFVQEHAGEGVCTLPRHRALRHELADRVVEAHVARMLSLRVVALQAKGLIPNYEASVVKTYASELTQRIYNTAVKVLGLYGALRGNEAPGGGRYARGYMEATGSTIAAGTSEIQRNIIAIRGLGLPRD